MNKIITYMMVIMIFMFMLMLLMMSFILNFSILLDFEFMNFLMNSFNFIILLDFYSMTFLMSVLLISGSVWLFSISYMMTDKYNIRFHFLLLSFVISMLLLIISPNLISILIGWDGLGISSYLLVIYYSSTKSYNAGMITVMSNRVGDALIIICFSSLIYMSSLNIFMTFFLTNYNIYWIFIFLIIAGCTKSAQIPFSAWLPAAMAAPTPVSALVHSSTLVTAGIYLMFRYESLLILMNINLFLMIFGSLTMFMASVSAFFEMDMKKMVALSTLSQLGVMMASLGAGFSILCFFHLLSHAFFKALLFISAGNLIHASESYQDLRVMGGGVEILPLSTSIVIGCSGSLCGMPFMSAFYSKEAIIESLLMNNLSFFFYFIMVIGVFLTVYYSTRFIMMSLLRVTVSNPYFYKLDKDFFVNFSMLVLIMPAISSGSLLSYKLMSSYTLMLIPFSIKLLVSSFLLLGILIFYKFYMMKKVYFSELKLWILGSLWGLPNLSSALFINISKNLGVYLHKFGDFSWIYYSVTEMMLNQFKYQSILGLSFTNLKFIRLFNFMFLIFLIIIFLKF